MNDELDIFMGIVKSYDLTIPSLKRKYDHTFRVVDYASKIAKSINLDERLYKDVCVAALFHDLGRFPQFSTYQTFIDLKSFDHGDKSYSMLKELNYNNKNVLSAVKNHNKYKIEDGLSEEEIIVSKVIRDADKLDIMFKQGNEVYDDNFILTEELFNCFTKEELISNSIKDIEGPNYSILRTLAFIYDFNYKYSLKVVKDNQLVEKKIDNLYDVFKDSKLLDVKKMLNLYIERKLEE